MGKPSLRHSTRKVHWIIDFIRRERVHQKTPQLKFAYEADVAPSTHAYYECGRNNPASLVAVEKLLDALGYDIVLRPRHWDPREERPLIEKSALEKFR